MGTLAEIEGVPGVGNAAKAQPSKEKVIYADEIAFGRTRIEVVHSCGVHGPVIPTESTRLGKTVTTRGPPQDGTLANYIGVGVVKVAVPRVAPQKLLVPM
jgi:hypothetical protein